MGLREIIQKAVSKGVKATGNVRQACTYRGTVGIYDPETDEYEETHTELAVQGILAEFRYEEIDGDMIRPNDQQFIIDQLSMPNLIPQMNSTIIDEDDVEWLVKRVAQDPAKAHWLLHLRRPG